MPFGNKSYEENTFYGASTLSGLFLNGTKCDSTKGTMEEQMDLKNFGGIKEGEIDVFIDASKGILRSCVVGQLHENQEVYIDCLDNMQNKTGWVPHINLQIAKQEISICKISAIYYGKRLDIVWE